MWRYSTVLQYDPWTHFFNLWDKGQFQHFEVTGSPTGDGVFCEERSNDPVLCHSTLDNDALPCSATLWKFLESLNRHLSLLINPQRWDLRKPALGSFVCSCPVKWVLLLWRRQGSSTNTVQQGSGQYMFRVRSYIFTLITKEKTIAHSWVTREFNLGFGLEHKETGLPILIPMVLSGCCWFTSTLLQFCHITRMFTSA
jgi:hypothetical protein